MNSRQRTAILLAGTVMVGAGLGTAIWRVQRDCAGTAPVYTNPVVAPGSIPVRTDASSAAGRAVTSRTDVALPFQPRTGREALARLDASTPEREDPRDELWAPPVEALLADVVGTRVRELAPETRFVGAECRSRGCTVRVECPADREEICQQLASALVIVDGMVLRPQKQPANDEDHFLMLVDIELPPGDAEALRRAMALEEQRHPEVLERLAESIEMIRRDHEAGP